MILFLDFDGVLHPEGLGVAQDHRLFCCLPVLHELLRALPSLEVVFSTSWRLLYSPDELVGFVAGNAPDLAGRFLGITPDLDTRKRPRGIVGQREDEIRAWLATNGQASRAWLALDDVPEFFWPGCEGLYLVDWKTGLEPEDVPAIVESLRFGG